MTEMKFNQMMNTIEAHLISKYGIGYLNLSKTQRIGMISYTFHEYLREQRERQDWFLPLFFIPYIQNLTLTDRLFL